MRLREAGPGVRRDPWRAPAALRLLSGRLGGAGGSCCGFGAEVAVCSPRLADPRRAAASRRQWLQLSVLPSDRRHPLSFAVRFRFPVPGLGRLRGRGWRDVQEHVPERLPLHPLQHRQQTPADLGQKGERWGGAWAGHSPPTKWCGY